MNGHLNQTDLQDDVRRVFGNDYSIDHVSRMHGGAQKVVYKIDCSNGFSCVLYVWDLSMNYFKEDIADEEIRDRSFGSELFEANQKYLSQLGVKTPALYDLNKEKDRCSYDYALVEYIHGEKAEAYFHHADPRIQDQVFRPLGEMLAMMHARERSAYGKITDQELRTEHCHRMQLDNAQKQLRYASRHIDIIRNHYDKLLDTLHELESQIQPRQKYGFIHGELGPDHVLFNDRLEPYIIDIEGAMFFDIEHEHSFLEFRFGDFYRYVKKDSLDPQRMLFYRFHHHISLISGGLKLLHRGFPDERFAKELTKHHTECALRFIDGQCDYS